MSNEYLFGWLLVVYRNMFKEDEVKINNMFFDLKW